MSQPTINPTFKDYRCFDLTNKPWARNYDINDDGAIHVEDMKAFLHEIEGAPPIDKDDKSLNDACRRVKLAFLAIEARWLFQSILARQNLGVEHGQISQMEEIENVQADLMARLHFLSGGLEETRIYWKTKPAILEMTIRAIAILAGGLEEPFVTGINLAPDFSLNPLNQWWPLKVTNVHPYSAAAAAGIIPGDRLVKIGDRFVSDWSVDETFNGLIDQETQAVRGLAGHQGTSVLLGIEREGEYFEVLVERNIWSGRALSEGNPAPAWDGQVSNIPLPK